MPHSSLRTKGLVKKGENEQQIERTSVHFQKQNPGAPNMRQGKLRGIQDKSNEAKLRWLVHQKQLQLNPRLQLAQISPSACNKSLWKNKSIAGRTEKLSPQRNKLSQTAAQERNLICNNKSAPRCCMISSCNPTTHFILLCQVFFFLCQLACYGLLIIADWRGPVTGRSAKQFESSPIVNLNPLPPEE